MRILDLGCRGPRTLFVVGALALPMNGCSLDRLMSVDPPTQVLASDANNPSQATVLVNSMVGEFYTALGAYVQYTAEFTDIFDSFSVSTARTTIDARSLMSGLGLGQQDLVYGPLQRTRWYADDVLAKLKTWPEADIVGNRADLIATAAAYGGYATLMLAEGFCSMTFDGGPEVSRTVAFQGAIQRFDEALASGTMNANILNMARVGKARTLADLGNLTGAEAVAAMVPTSFSISTLFDANRTNFIFSATAQNQDASLSVPYVGRTHMGVVDPRMLSQSVTSPRRTIVQRKYTSLTSQITIASGREAELIIAEARLAAGDIPGAVAIINLAHARAGLTQYGGGTPAEVRDHLIEERRLELFLEGQHLGDMLRFKLPSVPPDGTPYVPFNGVGGGSYGALRCLPIPPSEYQNNPNFGGISISTYTAP